MHKFPIDKQVFAIVDNIHKLTEPYITTEVNKLLADESYAQTILSDEYPMEKIIKQCFSEYIDGKKLKQTGVMIDKYSIDKPMKYSINNVESYPEFMKHIPKELIRETPKLKSYAESLMEINSSIQYYDKKELEKFKLFTEKINLTDI